MSKVGVAMDNSPTSKLALKWAADNLVQENGWLIVIQVQSSKSEYSRKELFEAAGSPLVPLDQMNDADLIKQYGMTKDSDVLDILESVSKNKSVTVVAMVYWGDPREKLCDAADDLELDSLVLGSRGLGAMKRVLMGSVSNYVVSHASCPVTVVKGPAKS